MHMPTTRIANPTSWRKWKLCHPTPNETPQITKVRTESKTIRVVADISLVTDIPAKLKKATRRMNWSAFTSILKQVFLVPFYEVYSKCEIIVINWKKLTRDFLAYMYLPIDMTVSENAPASSGLCASWYKPSYTSSSTCLGFASPKKPPTTNHKNYTKCKKGHKFLVSLRFLSIMFICSFLIYLE